MSTLSGNIPHERVPSDQARAHAHFAIRRAWIWDVPDFAGLGTAIPDREWMVRDLDGRELFYLFELVIGDAPERRRVAWARVAASPIVGPPVLAIHVGDDGLDPDDAMNRALEQAQAQFPGSSPSGPQLVCYSYPKIGVQVRLSDASSRSVIYDAFSLDEVPPPAPDGLEGFGAWSYYERVVEARPERRRRIWERAHAELTFVMREMPGFLAENADKFDLVLQWQRLMDKGRALATAPTSYHTLRFSPRCVTTHHCFERYAQKTKDYCAVATAQMILDFYRYYHAQDQIAAAMGTIPGGTPNSGQLAGYQSLSNHGLVSTFDCCATWTEAKAELDANRPVKDGIPGHARALTGWARCEHLSTQSSTLMLQIYDPAPSHPGPCFPHEVVWEDWEAIPHTNFIYVRHA